MVGFEHLAGEHLEGQRALQAFEQLGFARAFFGLHLKMRVEAEHGLKVAAERPYHGDAGGVLFKRRLIGLHHLLRLHLSAARKAHVVVKALLLRLDKKAVLPFKRGQFAVAPGKADKVHHVFRGQLGAAFHNR